MSDRILIKQIMMLSCFRWEENPKQLNGEFSFFFFMKCDDLIQAC